LLGKCYEKGDGVKHDFEQAVYWYQKAADQGHAGGAEAVAILKAMLKEMFHESDYARRVAMKAMREKAVLRAAKAKFILVLALVIAVVALIIKFIAAWVV
jgi:TPR repeat protein